MNMCYNVTGQTTRSEKTHVEYERKITTRTVLFWFSGGEVCDSE